MLVSRLLPAFLLTLAASGPVLALIKSDILHRGKHFVITFAQVQLGDFTPVLQVSTDAEAATVRVSVPRGDFLKILSLQPYSSLELPLPLETRAQDNGIGDHAVKVEADTEVTAVGVNRVEAHNDAFLSIPTPLLGTDYYAVTWDYLPFINVAAAQNDTTLTLTFPNNRKFKPFEHLGKQYGPGSRLRVKLGAFQTYQIFSTKMFSYEDLTGTRVQADKPIAVYSGSLTSKVVGQNPEEYHHLQDHLEDQLLPVNLWGKEYVMFHAPGRSVSSILKLISYQDNTQVTLADGRTVRLSRGGDWESVDADRDLLAFLVRADKPVLAVAFEKSRLGDKDKESDPSMVTLVPNENFISTFSFMPLNDSALHTFQKTAVIVASKDIGSVRVNGRDLPDQRWSPVTGSSQMQTMEVSLTHQSYYIDSANPEANFMVYVIGSRRDESYAFFGGFRSTYEKMCQPSPSTDNDGVDNDCDGLIDEEIKDGKDNDGDGLIDEDNRAVEDCGVDQCHPQAICVNGQCQCKPPYEGEGRFSCVLRDEECMCTAFGDPHTVDFNEGSLEMPLQCRHLLAQVDLPDCQVRVFVEGREYGKNPLVSMLDKVEWSYGHPQARAPIKGWADPSGVFFESGKKIPFNTHKRSYNMMVDFQVDESYFYSIESKCGVEIRYRAPVVTVRRPLPVNKLSPMERQGLCGECNRLPPKNPSNVTQSRVRALLSIQPSKSSPFAKECGLVQQAMQSCRQDRREVAVSKCQPLLDPNGPVSKCRVPITPSALYMALAYCLDKVCKGHNNVSDAFKLLNSC